MSCGMTFQQRVDTLREIGFPVDKVTGGDIQRAFESGEDIKKVVELLHRMAEDRRRARALLNRNAMA